MARFARVGTAALALLLALWTRLHNVRAYPADWGFDASFNWRYIAALSRHFFLPRPDAGWSTSAPPLYFAVCALLVRAAPGRLILVPLLSAVLGLLVAAMAFVLVRRGAPGDPTRAGLAALLVLFLPAHVYMSAMVNEEMLCAALTSAALLALCHPRRAEEKERQALGRALRVGAAGGLALLSKLTGLLTIAVGVATCALDGWRARDLRRAAVRGGALLAVAMLTGGWFYARNRILYGYFQPFGLPAHQRMFQLPPGERQLLDYVRFPLATFTDPQLLDPDLLHSVWGSTYASLWFDAQRSFLPTHSDAVRRLGTLTLLLALLPSAAFAAGLLRGARRTMKGSVVDPPLLAIVVLTLAGYAAYTWQNPWYVVLKGTSLLGLCLPYAFYASETLLDWARRGRARGVAIGVLLALLAACVTASGTFNVLFQRTEVSGLTPQSNEGAPLGVQAP